MPLDGDRLGAAIKAGVRAVEDSDDHDSMFRAVGVAIVDEFRTHDDEGVADLSPYLKVDGSRDVTGLLAFNAGLVLGGTTLSDVRISTDAIATSDAQIPTVGYLDAHYASQADLAATIGVTDHGALTGLGDNDHPQYALAASLVTDHAALTGLAADDHTQYLLASGARAVVGAMVFSAGLIIGGNTASDVLLAADLISTSDLALTTAGYVDARYASLDDLTDVESSIVTDHGALAGLADDDHLQYLLADGTRDSSGTQAFSAGVSIGGNTASDIFIAADPISASDLALATAGYVDANYASSAELAAVEVAAITDHGELSGLADDDHTQYLLAAGTRASTGLQTFSSGISIGGNTGSDILVGTDALSVSNLAFTTAGYVDAHYATNAELADVEAAAITDHGDLTGLGDDDHLQYLLVDGSRAMTGALATTQALVGDGNGTNPGHGFTSVTGAGMWLWPTGPLLRLGVAAQTIVELGVGGINLNKTTTVAGGLKPSTTSTRDLGLSGFRWRTLFVDDIVATASVTAGSVVLGGSTASDILVAADPLSALDTDLTTAGYLGAYYASLDDLAAVEASIITDHGELAGLSDDDHAQYLLATGTRSVSGAMTFDAGLVIGGNTGSDILLSTDLLSASNLALATAGYVDAHYVTTASVITDHGALTGLGDDDHAQYLLASGARASSGVQTFSAGVSIGGNTGSDILIAADLIATSDLAFVTAGYLDAHYASLGDLAAVEAAAITDHGDLTGLADDDHTQYLLASGARASSGVQTFSAGVAIGGNTVSDVLLSSDIASTSDLALVTAGYFDAHASAGVTDHGGLTGLTDDDHTQYLLASGTRASSGVQTFSAGVSIGGNTGSDILVGTDGVSTSNLAFATAGYVDANYASSADLAAAVVTDHGGLTGLADDDHTQYLLATGARAVSGVMTFSAGLSIGGNTGSDIVISTDGVSTSNLALTTAGYVDANYASLADLDNVAGTIISDHGGLAGLGDDDHTQYLLATGARAVSGAMTFSAGLVIGGNAGSDIYIATDGITPSNTALASAGYVDANYASLGDLSAVEAAIVTRHSDLTGLADDDHLQYVLVDGSRAITGGLSIAGEVSVGGLTNSGDESHGVRTMNFSAGLAIFMTSGGATIDVHENSSGFDWTGRLMAAGTGNILAVPITLRNGDRLLSVRFRFYGNGAATKRFSVIRANVGSTTPVIMETQTNTESSYNDHLITMSPTYLYGTASYVWAQMRCGAIADRFYGVEVTYDRP